jgi:uncharacterized membrane protein
MSDQANDLERDLRQALRRKQPSAKFAARVLASLPQERPRTLSVRMHRRVLRWAVAAVVVITATGGGYMYREHQRELERGKLARQQLMLALRITGEKLQLAQKRVQQIGLEQEQAPHGRLEREQ